MRTPTKDIVKKISKILRNERPDYIYLRDYLKKFREEFNIQVTTKPSDYLMSNGRGIKAIL